MKGTLFGRLFRCLAVTWALLVFFAAGVRVLADCSSFGLPFTDLGSETTFCAAIAEAYYTGITGGTSATTFSPQDTMTRDQGVAFATRTLDAALGRGSRRAALGQWWTTTPHYDQGLGVTTVGSGPVFLQSDGADVWVVNGDATISRVRGSDGKLLETWTGATGARGVLVAMGRVFVTGVTAPPKLYLIDPSQAAGSVTTVTSSLGNVPDGIAFDGEKIWTANGGGSVSIVTPGTWDVTTLTTGLSEPVGALFDGANVWVTDYLDNTLKRLGSDGSILQSVPVGGGPRFPVFDGHNIWVPNASGSSLTVVRASDGIVLKTFSAGNGNQNGLSAPDTAAFDGERVLVANAGGGVSLFKAADLSAIGSFFPSTATFGACSDGVNFWVSLQGPGQIGRF